jgi:plasmid stabilization system protein ParE
METRNVIWTPAVREKLIGFRSSRFTPEETFDFISQLVLEIEEILKNPLVGKVYTEEFGKYKGISRIVIKKFQIYFKQDDNNIVIIAFLFPGENK